MISYTSIYWEKCCFPALAKGLYRKAGMLFSYSIVHGGPLPKFLSPVSYDTLMHKATEVAIDDVQDIDIKEKINKILF